MVTAAGTKPKKALDLSFLNGGADQALPDGLVADPTYLAFLRGMGMDRTTAWTTAIQHIAATKAAYKTAVTRDPQILKEDQRQTDVGYSGHNNWFSGGRLADEAQNQVEDQQRLQDYSTTQATALSGIHGDLQNQLSQLARSNADQIGELQARRDAQLNQDKYIKAVGVANAPVAPAPDPLAAALTKLLGTGQATGAAPEANTDPRGRLGSLNPAQASAFQKWTAPRPVTPRPRGQLYGTGTRR